MIAEFESRLAAVLRGRLPAPLTGRVAVAPASSPGNAAQVVLGAVALQALDPDLGSRRLEAAPGAAGKRRVVRLACDLALEVRAGPAGADRSAQMAALDTLIFELEAPDIRDGTALVAAGDPGFLIQELRVLGADAPLAAVPGGPRLGARARAEGWFWPVGAVGQAGVEIASVRVRGGVLPIEVEPADPRPVAGGAAIDMTIRVRPVGTLLLGAAAPRPQLRLAVACVEAGGTAPGAGTLAGGVDGTAGARVLTLADDAAQVTYTPPPAAAHDELLVALDDGEGGPSVELGRVALEVRAA